MATWVTHLMVADNVLKKNPFLCRHEFCVGKQPELKKAAAGLYRLFTPRGNCAESKGNGIYAAKRGGTISMYRIFQRGICSVCKQCHAAGDRGN